MIEEMMSKKLSKDESQHIQAMKRSMDSPFVEKIKRFRPPDNFIQPQFKEFFDGRSGDPVEHIQHFQASMSLWGYSDELLCRTFPTTLTGKALTWFSQLQSGSIANFEALSDAFFEQYKINLGSKKGSSHLFLLRKETSEDLLSFTKRFRQEVSEVGTVDAGLVIEAYKNALPCDEFGIYNSLTVQPVGTLRELYDRADRYGRAEKEKRAKLSRATKGAETGGQIKSKPNPEGDLKRKTHNVSGGQTEKVDESRRPQRRERVKFPDLNIGLDELFEKIKDSLPVPKLLPEINKEKRDKNKYCAHHKDYGHTTRGCHTLATEVQKMIDEGKLQQYVKKNPPQVNMLDIREIRVSHARIDSASRNAYEKATRLKLRQIQDWRVSNKVDYANLIDTETLEEGKTEISFSKADLVGVYQPHNDAIVILALIGMYKVRRVLIDTGSSISVIFSGAYSSMNLHEGQIESDESPIVGFSGESVMAIGRVRLPTTVGGKTVMQYYSLLDCRAPYNAILGRDWIEAMEVVTSTIHQCLKFVTPSGVMKVRSDQVASHKCHESAMEEYKRSEVKGGEILQAGKKA